MSQLSYVQLPNLVVLNGATTSNVISAYDAIRVIITSPADIKGKTYTFEGNPKVQAASTDSGWVTIQSEASNTLADLSVPAVSKGASYKELCAYGSFRLKASADPGADVSFGCGKQTLD